MPHPQTHHSGEIPRDDLIQILQSALKAGEHRFARRAALHWLSQFPGDLEVSLLGTQAFLAGGGQPGLVQGQLHQLTMKDPYFLEAYRLGVRLWNETGGASGRYFVNCLHAADGSGDSDVADWARALRTANQHLDAGEVDAAEVVLLQVIAEDPATPLLALTHLKLLKSQAQPGQRQADLVNLKILQHYAHRWETCLPIQLALAEALLEGPDPDRAVASLHGAMAEDVAGQVVKKIYGPAHPFTELWPRRITGTLDLSLPASIAGIFGWNLLPADSQSPSVPPRNPGSTGRYAQSPAHAVASGERSAPKSAQNDSPSPTTRPEPADNPWLPETLVATQSTLEQIAAKIKRPELMQSEGRYPVYLIMSAKNPMLRKYGETGCERILGAARQLHWAAKHRKGWDSLLLLVDDPQSAAAAGVRPVVGEDAWAIKRLLAEVDEKMARRGQMIGALLILGGPEIIPFHHLPNPVDDLDIDVPSDNPYASTDDNYFVPEWPVGRLPGDSTSDPASLIRAINRLVNRYAGSQGNPGWLRRVFDRVKSWFRRQELTRNYGYTAAIWSRASAAVFQPLGPSKSILISPPASYQEFRKSQPGGPLGYFNLHGIQDSADWYGHMDPSQPANGPDFPVALRPADLNSNSRIPAVVFSEACFGANILDKTEKESIPLRFLAIGADCFVGSTCTAYGAVTTPLIAADFLAFRFWKHIRAGAPAGEALKRAKIDLVQEMDKRQGYLDGEDQKTLISFNLFGDPLFTPGDNRQMAKEVLRPLEKPEINTVDEIPDQIQETPLPAETVYAVKQMVREYLPGLENGQLKIHKLETAADGQSSPDGPIMKSPGSSCNAADRQVVTISKSYTRKRKTHHQFARLTLDRQGKLLKISVSR